MRKFAAAAACLGKTRSLVPVDASAGMFHEVPSMRSLGFERRRVDGTEHARTKCGYAVIPRVGGAREPFRKTGGAHLKSDTGESPASFPDVSVHEPLSFGLRCKTMARRASCDLQQAAGVCVVCAANATALAVFQEVAKHASLPRARRAALVVVGPCDMEGHCTGGRSLFFGARI